ncbi:DUF1127 domain-containing protein [Microvirga sp. 2MCAF38]|uniref:DUF1127 domain-containing protein n=1 Tax=Microvirga sp. 2MCAF38 TaxID=3232989 RepID=UPI003F94957A
MNISVESGAFAATNKLVLFADLWHRLRLLGAIRRTRLAISDLSDDQLRDIGLGADDFMAVHDVHQLYWRKHLGFS